MSNNIHRASAHNLHCVGADLFDMPTCEDIHNSLLDRVASILLVLQNRHRKAEEVEVVSLQKKAFFRIVHTYMTKKWSKFAIF